VRFSAVASEADTDRDVRGFAIKFYTEEGNYDIVGNNTPIFFVRDPMKFPDFIHSQERLPDSGLRSNNMQWDFWTLSPESAHQVAILMSDRPRAAANRSREPREQTSRLAVVPSPSLRTRWTMLAPPEAPPKTIAGRPSCDGRQEEELLS
jgi:hypothetical protein